MFLGIDPSIRRTGICFADSGGFETHIITPPEIMRGMERLSYLEAQFKSMIADTGLKGAAIEGYAFGVKGGRLADLAEWGGLIRMALYRAEIPTITVPPQTLKKYLVGGGIEKNKILLEVFKKYGVECGTDDEADALVLADMARHKWGRIAPKTERQREALQKAAILIEGQSRLPKTRIRQQKG